MLETLDIEERAGCSIPGTHESREPLINVRGEKIGLGPFAKEDVRFYRRWLNDFDTLRRAGIPIKPAMNEQMEGMLERLRSTEDRVWFVVYELSSGLPIGFAGISQIDLVNRTAEFNICIGERAARGKGYGTEAARLVLDYAFTARGLHSVYLVTSEINIAGQRAYAKAGFKEFGRRRKALMQGGLLWDAVHMDCLAVEFRSPVLSRDFGLEALVR